jgi:hypothetical protein
LWLSPALLGPNSSDVTDTATENTNPELTPIKGLFENPVVVPLFTGMYCSA